MPLEIVFTFPFPMPQIFPLVHLSNLSAITQEIKLAVERTISPSQLYKSVSKAVHQSQHLLRDYFSVDSDA